MSMGRKGIGAELKDTYFKQAIENLTLAKVRFEDAAQMVVETA